MPVAVKPMVLALNILVGLIATVRYYRAGFFSWRTFWPFAAGSVPFAFLASTSTLPFVYFRVFRFLMAGIIFYSAARLFLRIADDRKTAVVPIWIAPIIGAAIGSITGFTGVGGGIFLSPILLVMHWAKPEEACGVSAAFILVNSIAALSTNAETLLLLPADAVYLAPAVIIGAWIGTELGSRGLPIFGLRPLLAVVFVLGGIRVMLGG
jgi:uncharacterized membrane protein YfcA